LENNNSVAKIDEYSTTTTTTTTTTTIVVVVYYFNDFWFLFSRSFFLEITPG